MDIKLRIKSLATSILGTSRVYPIRGFDVSSGVGVVDWEDVRTNTTYNFASFRACLGKNTDTQFANNVVGVNSIGMPWYPYFVPKFGNWEGETDHFLMLWDKYGGSPMPPEIDVEYPYNQLNKSQTLIWLTKSYNKILLHTGFSSLIMYSNKNYWNNHVEMDDYIRRFALKEVAQWNQWIDEPDLIPDNWAKWLIWQWWHKVKVSFAPGNIDDKRFNGDRAEFVSVFGVEPYYASVAPPIPPSGDSLLMKVLQQDLRIRKTIRGEIIGHLDAGEILEVLDIGGTDSWVLHERGWSNVQDGLDINMTKYIE